MKLIPEMNEEKHTIKLAAQMSVENGFCAMFVDEEGRCALIPPQDIYALSVKHQKKIDEQIKRLRENAK